MNTFLSSLLIGLSSLNNSYQVPALKEFVRDALETKLTNTEIGDKYFCKALLRRSDQSGEKARGYLEIALSHQRDNLRAENVNPNEVTATAFNALPDKPIYIIGETDYVYVIQYKGKPLIYVLMKDEKIASTLLP